MGDLATLQILEITKHGAALYNVSFLFLFFGSVPVLARKGVSVLLEIRIKPKR